MQDLQTAQHCGAIDRNIAVQQQYHAPSRRRESCVVSARVADVLRKRDELYPRVSIADGIGRAVLRAVVDDEGFDHQVGGGIATELRINPVETLEHQLAGVPCQDHDREIDRAHVLFAAASRALPSSGRTIRLTADGSSRVMQR